MKPLILETERALKTASMTGLGSPTMMRILFVLLVTAAIFSAPQLVVSAETFRVVDDEWLWFSSNLAKTNAPIESKMNQAPDQKDTFLGNATYDNYFERHGQPPDYSFLQKLTKNTQAARIEGNDIVFLKTGLRLPLKTDITPDGSDPALPYVLGIPNTKLLLIVYPYYFFGCKDNEHFVELYSEDGSFFHQFDSLPTHAFRDNPQLLVSPERSGCCDSLKWSVRFYDLRNGTVSKYGCPEGACGDLLFTRLEESGFFLLGTELIGTLSGVGAFIQTNIHVINDDGLPVASGKIIHALRNPPIHRKNIQGISPFSISKFSALTPKPGNERNIWFFEFKNGDNKYSFLMHGQNNSTTPAVVFLMPKETGPGEMIEFNNREIGFLPCIVVCDAGSYSISGRKSKIVDKIKVQSDTINKYIF